MKILSVIGTRPQFIKLFPIKKAVEDFNNSTSHPLNNIVVNTGQHFDRMLSDVFLKELDIKEPDYNLGVKEKSQCNQIGEMILRLEKVLMEENPNLVLVYGDTNSTLAGALSAKKMNFKVAHIEAGVRSFNKEMPEEINRILTDKISDILFCPTENAIRNLKNEGFFLKKNKYKVYNVGDVMYDTFLIYKEIANDKSQIISKLFGNKRNNFILVTIHRKENTDNILRLRSIFEILAKLSNEIFIIFPIHPRTKEKIKDLDAYNSKRFIIIEPVSYFDMLVLEKNADFIITDSGGVQREAYFFNTPCITLRKETEWIETLKRKNNFLVDLEYKKKLDILNMPIKKRNFPDKLFGDGTASRKIIKIISNELDEKRSQ